MIVTITHEEMSCSQLVTLLERSDNLTSLLLEHVTLTGTRGRDSLLLYFRGHLTLESVHLRHVQFAPDDGEQQQDLELILSMLLVATYRLQHLRLEDIAIPPSVFQCLAYNRTLKSLQMIRCRLTDVDAARLVQGLQKQQELTDGSSGLRSLNLRGNWFTAQGRHTLEAGLRDLFETPYHHAASHDTCGPETGATTTNEDNSEEETISTSLHCILLREKAFDLALY